MKIKATTPCYKFRDATPEEQIAKIKEELAEVEVAYIEFKKVPTEDKLLALMMEIIDVKACCNTFVYQLRKNHALREIFNNFKRLQDKECVSISSEQE